MFTSLLRTVGVAALAAFAGMSAAQDQLNHPVGQIVGWGHDTGVLANPTDTAVVVASHVVHPMDNVSWLRVYFKDVVLDKGSFVRITSLKDGESQKLDASAMEMWSNSTAYFNGDVVLVELVAGPGTMNNRLQIDRIGLELPIVTDGGSGQCGICGTDDRVQTSELWSGRLMPIGCTGSMYCNGDGMISAGHCMTSNLVMQFNVPNSTSGCATVAPAVNDQFPVLAGYQFSNAGVGNDWAVARIGTNGLGQTPVQRYGVFRPLATAAAGLGSAATMWGYGVDLTCTRTQTQQQSPPGAITAVAASNYQFNADVRGGNSGSGLLNASNQIIAVVTHCSTGCPNYGTRIDLPAFVAARNAIGCGSTSAPANNACASATAIGIGSVTGTTVGASADGTTTCGNSDTTPDVWYSFTPSCPGTYRFTTCDATTNYDSVVSVHSACAGTAANTLACNDDIGAACTALNTASQVDVALVGGTTYRVRVSGFQGASGNFRLTTSLVSSSPSVTITQHPQPRSTCPTVGAPFSVTATSTGGALAYRWQIFSAGTWINLTTGGVAISCGGTAFATTPLSSSSTIRVQGCSGTFSVRCLVSTPCDATPSNAASLTVCAADLNCDGLTDFNDYLEFLNLYNTNNPAADFNGDGLVDFNDYLEFLNLYNTPC